MIAFRPTPEPIEDGGEAEHAREGLAYNRAGYAKLYRYSAELPTQMIVPGRFVDLALTRNDSTKETKAYVDGVLRRTVADQADYAVTPDVIVRVARTRDEHKASCMRRRTSVTACRPIANEMHCSKVRPRRSTNEWNMPYLSGISLLLDSPPEPMPTQAKSKCTSATEVCYATRRHHRCCKYWNTSE